MSGHVLIGVNQNFTRDKIEFMTLNMFHMRALKEYLH